MSSSLISFLLGAVILNFFVGEPWIEGVWVIFILDYITELSFFMFYAFCFSLLFSFITFFYFFYTFFLLISASYLRYFIDLALARIFCNY